MLGSLIRFFLRLMLLGMLGMLALILALAIVSELTPLIAPLAMLLFLYWVFTRQAATNAGRTRVGAGPQPRPWFSWPNWIPTSQERPERWEREARELAHAIHHLVRRSNRAARETLTGVPASARKLADRVRDLVRLYRSLEEHLRENGAVEFSRRAAEMEQHAQAATDPFARDQYLAAAQSLQRQVQMCAELSCTQERLHAEIARILAALTNLRSRIVAAHSGTETAINDIDRASDELANLQSQVETFQASVNQVLHQARG